MGEAAEVDAGREQPPLAAARLRLQRLDRAGFAAREPFQGRRGLGLRGRRQQGEEAFAGRLALIVAEQFLRAAVHAENAPAAVEPHHAVARRIQRGGEIARARGVQRGLAFDRAQFLLMLGRMRAPHRHQRGRRAAPGRRPHLRVDGEDALAGADDRNPGDDAAGRQRLRDRGRERSSSPPRGRENPQNPRSRRDRATSGWRKPPRRRAAPARRSAGCRAARRDRPRPARRRRRRFSESRRLRAARRRSAGRSAHWRRARGRSP